MSGTSHTNGRVPFSASEHFRGEDPVDTRLAQDCLIGGGRAQADAFGQCLINWMPVNPAVSGSAEPFQRPRRLFNPGPERPLNEWMGLMTRHVGTIRVRADGSSYRFYVVLIGASSDGNPVDFGVSISFAGAPHLRANPRARGVGALPDPQFVGQFDLAYSGITSTAPIRLESDSGLRIMALSAGDVRQSLVTEASRTDLDGDPIGIDAMPYVEIRVFGRAANPLTEPHLYGCLVSEFIG